MKKIVLSILAFVMLISFVSCKDDEAPDGMKLASNKDIVAYSLFVPEEWTIDEQSAMTVAHVSSADKSSVSVMQWNLTSSLKSIDDWWTFHKQENTEAFPSLTVVEEGVEGIIDNRPSKSYTYTIEQTGLSTDGKELKTVYKFYVTAVIDQGSIHIITYTSTDEMGLYDKNITTVKDKILPNFKFN